jgi:hypothetical protein
VVAGIKEVMNARSEAVAKERLATVALWNSAFLERREPTFRGGVNVRGG